MVVRTITGGFDAILVQPGITQQGIIDRLELGTYPYNILIRHGQRAYHDYQSIEVDTPRPITRQIDPETIVQDQTFNINIFVRYNREIPDEIIDLELIEQTISNLLNNLTISGGVLSQRGTAWARTESTKIYGVTSSASFSFTVITPSIDGAVLGGGTTLLIGGVQLDLIRTSVGQLGRSGTRITDDVGNSDPIANEKLGDRFFEYTWLKEKFDAIDALIESKNYVSAVLTEGGQITTFDNVLPLNQRDSVSFTGLKTVVLQIEIVRGITT